MFTLSITTDDYQRIRHLAMIVAIMENEAVFLDEIAGTNKYYLDYLMQNALHQHRDDPEQITKIIADLRQVADQIEEESKRT